MTLAANPFCPKCGFRLYPQWGPHECKEDGVSEESLRKVRHTAGDILTNLHFYRIAPDLQLAALAEAFAFTVAANIVPHAIGRKLADLQPKITKLIDMQLQRQAQGTNAENIVMDVSRPRMTVKKKKGVTRGGPTKKVDRPDHQTVSAGRARRHGRTKGRH